MSTQEFNYIRKLIYELARIKLGDDKKQMVMSRLQKRLNATDCRSYGEYITLLDSPAGHSELSSLVDALSTNHTYFFREQAHFTFLQNRGIPELVGKGHGSRGSKLRFWSAVCSTGEEPSTLAIVMEELLASHPGCDYHIECSDISTRALKIAREGRYDKSLLQQVSPTYMAKYFKHVDGVNGHSVYELNPRLRSKMNHTRINLFQPSYPYTRPFHVIFCRNVMIYFDVPTQEQLVNRLFNMLVPGGYLMIGHSENLMKLNHKFTKLQPAIYQRPE